MELLDELLFEQYKVHFLEPMAEVVNQHRVKVNPNQQKDLKKLLVNQEMQYQRKLKGFVRAEEAYKDKEPLV